MDDNRIKSVFETHSNDVIYVLSDNTIFLKKEDAEKQSSLNGAVITEVNRAQFEVTSNKLQVKGETPAEVTVETPVEISTEVAVETPVEISTEVAGETPVEISTEVAGETPIETLVETSTKNSKFKTNN